jgi:hypothetical protein
MHAHKPHRYPDLPRIGRHPVHSRTCNLYRAKIQPHWMQSAGMSVWWKQIRLPSSPPNHTKMPHLKSIAEQRQRGQLSKRPPQPGRRHVQLPHVKRQQQTRSLVASKPNCATCQKVCSAQRQGHSPDLLRQRGAVGARERCRVEILVGELYTADILLLAHHKLTKRQQCILQRARHQSKRA